jgi:branched-chain amino acid transport system permease protein
MTTFLISLVLGLTTGGIYAIAATGLVVTYVTSRVFNFAYGALGMFVAYCYYQMRVQWGWPTLVALAVSLLVLGPLVGVALDRALMSHLQSASVAVKLVATLALSLLFQGLAEFIWGSKLRTMPAVVSSNTFSPVHGLKISYDQVCIVIVAALVALGMWVFLRRTTMGATMRAVVDSSDLAELNGVSPRRVTSAAWAIGTSLAGLAAILIAPSITLSIPTLTSIVVVSYAAAVIGRLSSMFWTFVGGLLLGLVATFLIEYLPPTNALLADLSQAAPFVFMVIALIVYSGQQTKEERTDNLDFGRPPRLATTLIWSVAGIALAIIVQPHLSAFYAYVVGTGLVFAMVLLTLVFLTGLSGQVSLAQFSFVGVGAVLLGHLAPHMPYIIALVVAVGVTALVGGVVALPAVRMRGLYLALLTFAFAVMMDQVVFSDPHVISDTSLTIAVPAPSLFGWHLTSANSQLPLLTAVVAAMGVAVLWVRRGPIGRRMSALRDAPASASALGLNVVRTKVVVFAVAAGAAGLAGSLMGGIQGSVSATEFTYTTSLIALLIVVMQGVGSVAGSIVGAAFYAFAFLMLPQWVKSEFTLDLLQPVLIGLGVLNLAVSPAGAAAIQRRQFEAIKSRLRVPGKLIQTDSVGSGLSKASAPPVVTVPLGPPGQDDLGEVEGKNEGARSVESHLRFSRRSE